jgi:hypothetical protein
MAFFKKLVGLIESFEKVSKLLPPRTSPPQLVRDWIEMSLYDPKIGYFEKETGTIAQISKEIDFNS